MTAVIKMASVSPWNSKIPGNRRLSEEKDGLSLSSSWSRRELEKSNDRLPLNGSLNIDSSNTSDFNNSNNNIVNHRNFNGNSEMDSDDHLVDKHNLVSITENPFFKSYGKIRALHTRNEFKAAERERYHSDSSPLSPKIMSGRDNGDSAFTSKNSGTQNEDEEEEFEYHPGSGFVSKVLGKLKMKYEKEERAYPPVPMKKSASLENILDDRPVSSTCKSSKGVKNDSVSSVIGQSNLNKRTKSVEHITNSSKHVPGKRAPDLKLARKDIVIIESSKSGTRPTSPTATHSNRSSSDTHKRSGSLSPTITTTSLREEATEVDELPKPNTVTNTRHLFEASPQASVKGRSAAPPRPTSAPGTRISTVAPTKNTSTTITTSAHSSKTNQVHKPKDVVNAKPSTEAHLPRSGLPPISNRNKKPSPVVTVAPYKPKSDESYSTSSSSTVPLPQKPSITPRNGSSLPENKPTTPKITQNKTSAATEEKPVHKEEKIIKETKPEKFVENDFEKQEKKADVQKSVRDSYKLSEEIIPQVHEKEEKSAHKTPVKETNSTELSDSNSSDASQQGPVKGIPTIIAQRMKKETNGVSVASNGEKDSSQVSEIFNSGSSENTSVKKRQAPAVPTSSAADTIKSEPEKKEDLSPRQNLHHSQKSKDISGPAMVFDGSMVAKKKRKPNYSTQNNSGVPKLDLTGINDNRTHHGYQEGYKPTEIKPCKIIFIGAFVDTGRSLLKKENSRSSNKGRIKFDDQAITLHEYPSELHMLEEYLLKHPDEEELVILETFSNDIVSEEDTPPGTPRHNAEDEVLKSNTALSHSGGLSSYVSKYQSEFDWNNHRDSEPIVIRPVEQESDAVKSEELIPAGEDDTNTWSESTTSDLLF